MKKLLSLSLILGAMAFAVPSAAEAKTSGSPAAAIPQNDMRMTQNRRYRRWENRRWNNRRVRTVTTTRIRRIGFRTYRETIRTTYLPNGGTRTVIINRVRIR